MTDYFIRKLTDMLKTDDLDDYGNEILKYGITATVLNLPKTILLFIIAKKLGLLKPLCLLFIFYGTIRNFSRGIHAKTPIACFIIGNINYIGMAYLSKFITIPQRVYNVVYAYCFTVYYKFAPSGTEINPVYQDQIKLLKKWSLLTIVIYYFAGLKEGLIRNVSMLSVLSQSISILPITFKIAKQKGGVVYEEE